MSIFRRPHGYLHLQRPKERGQSHWSMRLHQLWRLLRKLAAVSDRRGSEREQPLMKFGESKGERMGTRSAFLWKHGFPVLSRRITWRVSF